MIECDQRKLADALRAVKPAVGSSVIQALACVRLLYDDDGAVLLATNMDIAVRKGLPCRSRGSARIDALVPHAKFARAVTACKGQPIRLGQGKGSGLVVKAGKRTIELNGCRLEDFPPLDFDTAEPWLSAPADRFAVTAEKAVAFASRDQTRPLLTGVQVSVADDDVVRFVATDSYRLCVLEEPDATFVEHRTEVIHSDLFRSAIASCKNADRVELRVGKDFAVAAVEPAGITWRARLIPGKYPEWQKLLPDTEPTTRIAVSREALLNTATAATQLARRNSPLRLTVNGKVTVAIHEPDALSMVEQLEATVLKKPKGELEIGLNPEFIRDTVRVADSDVVELQFIQPLRPALIKDASSLFLVMPIRLTV